MARSRSNPSAVEATDVAMKVLAAFGVGALGYIAYRRFRAPSLAPQAATPIPGTSVGPGPITGGIQTGNAASTTNTSTPQTSAPLEKPTEPPAKEPEPSVRMPSPEELDALAAHNSARADVGVAPLVWDEELSREAQAWADHLASLNADNPGRPTLNGNPILHKPNNPRGENIYWMRSSGEPPTMGYAVRRWETERANYNVADNRCEGGICGHYTQMVWRASQRVGCGKAVINGQTFIVCEYDPSGNYTGQRPY